MIYSIRHSLGMQVWQVSSMPVGDGRATPITQRSPAPSARQGLRAHDLALSSVIVSQNPSLRQRPLFRS